MNFILNRFRVRRWLNIQINITNSSWIYGLWERLKLDIQTWEPATKGPRKQEYKAKNK